MMLNGLRWTWVNPERDSHWDVTFDTAEQAMVAMIERLGEDLTLEEIHTRLGLCLALATVVITPVFIMENASLKP